MTLSYQSHCFETCKDASLYYNITVFKQYDNETCEEECPNFYLENDDYICVEECELYVNETEFCTDSCSDT